MAPVNPRAYWRFVVVTSQFLPLLVAYLLVIDVPGVTAETVEASVEGSKLRVEARREKDVPIEFDYVEEERSLFLDLELPLPPDVSGAEATGTIERGVLELELPKAASAPETPIPIDG
ncbi:molecular chaperone Hsp20 [Halobacteriales archaeon QH_6_68_27]|nr:MAG: molecular chaperone Hsp20 [Halobacteriales archaeon QH_6_68_27]